MNILFDISMIGLGHERRSAAQGGLYRAVDFLARGLAQSTACRLSFCAAARADLIAPCRRYCEKNSAVNQVPFAFAKDTRLLTSRTAGILLDRLPAKTRYPSKTGRRLHHMVKKTLQKTRDIPGRIPAGHLAWSDIFHSSVFKLPETVRNKKNLKKVLTIYDLTPVKFPQNWKNEQVIGPILKTWSPENWAFCISESTRNDFCEFLKIDTSRTFVTPLAADPELFYPCTDQEILVSVRRTYGIPEGNYILALNTLAPHKNIDHLIRCFTRLVRQERIKDLHLVLAGARGWREENIHAALADSCLENRQIHVIGFVNDEHLAALYSGASCFAFMSKYEGFGLPPLEAMQCGVPVITSNTASLPEVMGNAGIMLDPDDADGLCSSLLKVHTDTALRERLSERSLQRAGLFSWDRTVNMTIDGYRTMLES